VSSVSYGMDMLIVGLAIAVGLCVAVRLTLQFLFSAREPISHNSLVTTQRSPPVSPAEVAVVAGRAAPARTEGR
jgi:hypothetical protein